MNTEKRYLIYFFGTDFDRVKIGKTGGSLYYRQRHIQTGCPDPIALLGIIRCKDKSEMKKTEKGLHRQFEKHRTIGEWFRISSEITTYINQFTECGKDILEADHQDHLNKNRKKQREYNQSPEQKKYRQEYQRERYQNDPEYRKIQIERQRKCNKSPKRQEYICKYQRERYQNNPEVRERQLKHERERYQNDPEVRERKRKRERERYHRKKREALLESGQQQKFPFE